MRKSRPNLSLPLIVILGGIFLLAAGFVLVWQNNNVGSQAGNSQNTSVNVPFPEVERVSLAEAKTAFDAGSAVFVDVRDTGSYADHHIPGALSIPLGELTGRLSELNPADWIITYCT